MGIAKMLTVVVIEQDGAMRTLINEWLKNAGYGVDTAVLPTNAGADLVIVDIPNLRFQGVRTVRQVRLDHPRAVVIGISTHLGRSLTRTSALASSLGVVRLLAKPLARDELIAAAVEAIGMAR